MGTARNMIRLTSLAKTHWMHRIRYKLRPEPKPEAIGYILMRRGRVGSHALSNQLEQHPEIVAQSEFMAPHRNLHLGGGTLPLLRQPLKWLCPHKGYLESLINMSQILWRNASQRAGRHLRAYGFTFLRGDRHVLGLNHTQMLERFKRQGVGHFIFLERRNAVREYISSLQAIRNDLWHVRTYETIPAQYKSTLHVDLNDGLLALLDDKLAYNRRMRSRIEEAERLERSDERWLHLTYEDDIENDPGVGYAKVCEFLGVEVVPVVCKTRRLNAAPLSEIIENYDECVEYLRGTPYEKMLKD